MHESFLLNTYPDSKATLTRGEGSYLYDSQGKQYLDFLSGIAVTSLGHSNEEIATIISQQSSKLIHVSNYFENEYTQVVSSKLNSKITQDNLESGKIFFANSGAEANECAIKVAKRFGGGKKNRILSAKGSFHGRTIATLTATGQSEKHKNFLPLFDYFDYFDFGDIESLKAQLTSETVAVIIEIIQGENGVRVASPEFFEELSDFVRENDLLLIVDEIQTGMCRTGSWFAFQNYNLEPHIVTMAKALGNGFPIGACWVKNSIASCMDKGDHGSTFGGQPLALSVANAVIDIMDRDNLDENASKLGEYLIDQLEATELFETVRGKGLLVGCDLDRNKVKVDAHELVTRCFENGLIINATSENTLRLAPALNITGEQLNEGVSMIIKCCKN